MEDEIFEVMYFLGYGQFSDIFASVDALSSLYYDNYDYCEFGAAYRKLNDKCNNNPDSCGLGSLFVNAQ
jgi:hypothetical protein